jgi:hypothetical protein
MLEPRLLCLAAPSSASVTPSMRRHYKPTKRHFRHFEVGRRSMQRVEGRLSWEGTGAASDNLARQWHELIKYVPELQRCHQGTINVDLLTPVLVLNSPRTIPPFEWRPGQVEGFGMLEIRLEWPIETEPFQAFVYIAQHSRHRYNMMRADVITKHIPDLPIRKDYTDQNRRCRLHFSTVTGFLI